VRDVIINAVIPENAIWTGRSSVSAGAALEWNPKTHTITWKPGDVPPFFGEPPAIYAALELAVTPNEADIGQQLPLVRDITVTGADALLGTSLETTLPLITSSLPSDDLGFGKDRVVP